MNKTKNNQCLITYVLLAMIVTGCKFKSRDTVQHSSQYVDSLANRNSANGKFIVYKIDQQGDDPKMSRNLFDKFSGLKFYLSFAPKYVTLTREDDKQPLVLSRDYPEDTSLYRVYSTSFVRGADSVRFQITLHTQPSDTVLVVSAALMTNHDMPLVDGKPYYPAGIVDCYLSRVQN